MTEAAPIAVRPASPAPSRYFETVGEHRTSAAVKNPVCLYLETTNRCNLLCTTCPRTYAELEPPADMSLELFRSIVDQVPNLHHVPQQSFLAGQSVLDVMQSMLG